LNALLRTQQNAIELLKRKRGKKQRRTREARGVRLRIAVSGFDFDKCT
jgi:hypothetical protein